MWRVVMYKDIDPYVGREKYEKEFDTYEEAIDYMYEIDRYYDYVYVEEV